jgi:hypothetical protein
LKKRNELLLLDSELILFVRLQVITWGDAPTKAIFVLGTLAKQKTLNLLTKYASIISQLAKVHVELQLRGKIEL